MPLVIFTCFFVLQQNVLATFEIKVFFNMLLRYFELVKESEKKENVIEFLEGKVRRFKIKLMALMRKCFLT